MIGLKYRVLEALLAVSLGGLSSQAAPDPSSRPNVLFIMADDQDLLMNSVNFMPNLRTHIAGQGTTFNKHYCTNALCCPSRASLLAGKCVHNTNVTSVSTPYGGYPKFISEGLNNDYLPVWLQEGNVSTYYVGKFLNSHNINNYRSPKLKGWTSSHFLLEPGTYDYLNTTWTLDFANWENYLGVNALDITTDNALDMIDKAVANEGPFFLQVSPAIPHVGINASTTKTFFPIPIPKWANAFSDEIIPRTPNWNPDVINSGASWILNLPKQNQTTVDRLDELYRARIRTIAGLDDLVLALINRLDKHGILENTHIVYTSDNGYHLGHHRLGPGKLTGFETDINIPLFWRGPGVPHQFVESVSTHTDLAPTFLDIFGISQRPNFDGQLIPAVRPKTKVTASEHVNIENWQVANAYEVIGFGGISGTVEGQNNNTYKGVRIVGDTYSYYYSVWCTNQHELYDMHHDSYQDNNVLANVTSINSISNTQLKKLVERLDAVLLVLKSCVGEECTKPWLHLHPQGDVSNLEEALNPRFDNFYASQPKIRFSQCWHGYLIEYEGPQDFLQYGATRL